MKPKTSTLDQNKEGVYKVELHAHAQDLCEVRKMKHTLKQMVAAYARSGYRFLAITNHDYELLTPQRKEQLEKTYQIVLLYGIEKTFYFDKKEIHVVIVSDQQIACADRINDLGDLSKLQAPNVLIMLAHAGHSLTTQELRRFVERYDHLFDAYEHCFFYTRFWNRNKRVKKVLSDVASKKPLVTTSDLHRLKDLHHTNQYTLTTAITGQGLISHIKRGNIVARTRPLSFLRFLDTARWHILNVIVQFLKYRTTIHHPEQIQAQVSLYNSADRLVQDHQ